MVDRIKHHKMENMHCVETVDEPGCETVASGEISMTEFRVAKKAKALRKAETINALREVRLRQRSAASAEKKAKTKEARAKLLRKKAEAAQAAAALTRHNANRLLELVAEAERALDMKDAEFKRAVEHFRVAERSIKNTQKLENRQSRIENQRNKKPGSGKSKRRKQIKGLKAVGVKVS